MIDKPRAEDVLDKLNPCATIMRFVEVNKKLEKAISISFTRNDLDYKNLAREMINDMYKAIKKIAEERGCGLIDIANKDITDWEDKDE